MMNNIMPEAGLVFGPLLTLALLSLVCHITNKIEDRKRRKNERAEKDLG
jgi:hypothetical protein